MSPKQDLCFSLINWLQTFHLTSPHRTASDICDGTAMAEALSQIAPDYFDSAFISKIKPDVKDNWRLKVSNLKKILDKILNYYSESLNQQLNNFTKPDVAKIGEHCDQTELGRLLQLLLGCAVNCAQKQSYITKIMGMEESVQRVIMQAIQELESGSQMSLNMTEDFQLTRLMSDLDRVTEERDQMAQKCYELDTQVNMLVDEKTSLQEEVKKFQIKLQEAESPGNASVSSSKYGLLRRELDAMKEELFKAECARDDARSQLESHEKTINDLQSRVDELQALADEARILKDEMDVLRETADKAGKYEATIDSYKRKLEELSDLKRKYKLLEDKNAGFVQITMDLEEDLKRQGAWKSQAEVYKRQYEDLLVKQKEEVIRADKLTFEMSKVQEKLDALDREKVRLVVERDLLKETNEELTCQLSAAGAGTNVAEGSQGVDDLNMDLRERLVRLTAENRQLKMQQQETGELAAVQALLNAANEQIQVLTQDARTANRRILELEEKQSLPIEGASSDDISKRIATLQEEKLRLANEVEQLTQKAEQLDEQSDQLQRTNVQLKDALTRKETELAAAEERYKKCMDKAKAVISGLEPKQQSEAMRHQMEKTILQGLAQDREQPLINELKLMTNAFHHLSSQRQRESADHRMATLSTGQSFLARQRAPVARKVSNK